MKRVVLALAALGILSVNSVMAALVTVETLAGPMAAAKSTVTGTVTAVNVTVGSDVSRDQIVVTVESK